MRHTNPRCILVTTRTFTCSAISTMMLSLDRLTIIAVLLFQVGPAFAAEQAASWPAVTLAPAREVTLSGPLGEALQHGVARLAKPPYTEPWLRADVSFELQRIFTNYSGDVSGRFLELASLTSPTGKFSPPPLAMLLETIARFQKPDGHFGVPVDLSKPLPKNAPPIPMLWGNARLLVGLVTAGREFHREDLLASARRLGDFYVNTADQLCSPAREADYRSSGTYGDGYCCCYFPAIEGLAMLYQATKDDRYLKQAERMAEFFTKFDCLPVEHSHGNLCAWRGILDLYEITGNRTYLDRATAKWDAAVKGSFVWPLGGVGEHWHVFFAGDEGCSESDWLRFSLDLWRFTGQTRYLDVAERLLQNQYATNQCPNGGYGMAHLDGDAAGPVAAIEKIEEWPFCCSFHGPLGLHFLKGYLAAGSERGVFVNFPYSFTAPVKAAGREWMVLVRSKPDYLQGYACMEIEFAPRDKTITQPGRLRHARGTLWVRVPAWASAAKVVAASGEPVPAPTEGGYLRIEREFKAGDKLTVDFQNTLTLEGRKFQKVQVVPGKVSRVKDVAVLAGPDILFATAVRTGGRPVLLATLDADGRLSFPVTGDRQSKPEAPARNVRQGAGKADSSLALRASMPQDNRANSPDSDSTTGCKPILPGGGKFVTVTLPGIDATDAQITQALQSGRAVFLRTWPGIVATRHGEPAFKSVVTMNEMGGSHSKPRRLPFMFDLVVVPAVSLAPDRAKLAARAKEEENERAAPIFGENLEKRPEIWSSSAGWKRTPRGLLVSGGDTGLIDGEGYGDYRFEFELTIPNQGQGITGWVVRANDEANCLMFQLQTADSTFDAPEFKTRPNTLRPHRRTNGQWQIAEPVVLPKEIHKGEPHQIAVECRQGTVDVFLDGQRIYRQTDVDLRGGAVGFRASGPAEQGLFRAISLKKL